MPLLSFISLRRCRLRGTLLLGIVVAWSVGHMLRVGLLGSFRICLDGARVQSDLGPPGTLMAGFLFAFQDRAHRREQLAETFWPGLDSDRSRSAFNSAVWRLRKLIGREPASRGGTNLHTAGGDIILERAPWLEVDTQVLEQAEARLSGFSGSAELLGSNPLIECLRPGVECYEGPFLDGEGSNWVLEERERLHSIFVRIAAILIRHYGSIREYDTAISIARRVLRFDSYREAMVRYLVALLALDDQRAEAIKSYERWKLMLHRELGVAPMPATVSLMEVIRRIRSVEESNALNRELFSVPAAVAAATRVKVAAGYQE